jgi:hypothetical protein
MLGSEHEDVRGGFNRKYPLIVCARYNKSQ